MGERATPDFVTVLRSRGPRLAKLVTADGRVRGYDDAKVFDASEAPVGNLGDLLGLLQRLQSRPGCAVVRARPIGETRGIRRLLHPDRDGHQATLADTPHAWAAADMDDVPIPGIDPCDLEGCGRAALERVPAEFRSAATIVQATSGHGLKPGLARLRLWWWLDRPVWSHELRVWVAGRVPDACLTRPVQLHYTAAPVFEGRPDHLPRRLALLPGAAAVAVPPEGRLRPPPPRPVSAPIVSPGGRGRYVYNALLAAVGRIATAGAGSRHATILGEARSLARFVKSGLLCEAEMRSALVSAGIACGKPRDEIESMIFWSLDHPSPAFVPQEVRP